MSVPARYDFANAMLRGVTVSRSGEVYRDGQRLRVTRRGRGATVTVRSKSFRLARLVLISFGQLPPTAQHVAISLNGDPCDCRLENVEWAARGDLASRRAREGRNGLPSGVRVKQTRAGPRYQAILRGRSLGCYASPEEALFVRQIQTHGLLEAAAEYIRI